MFEKKKAYELIYESWQGIDFIYVIIWKIMLLLTNDHEDCYGKFHA